MPEIDDLLQRSAARHSHLCPRQVLGVRLALAGAAALELGLPRSDKRLLVIIETDGCFADGVEVTTGATIGHRTLRMVDYGKIAATFIDVKRDQAVRVAPRPDIRERAWDYAPDEKRRYFAQLAAYQQMPDEALLTVQSVQLVTSAAQLLSRPGLRVNCARCGEEIINQREIWRDGALLCQACAGPAYYIPVLER